MPCVHFALVIVPVALGTVPSARSAARRRTRYAEERHDDPQHRVAPSEESINPADGYEARWYEGGDDGDGQGTGGARVVDTALPAGAARDAEAGSFARDSGVG